MSKKIENTLVAMRDFALTFPEAWEDFPWDHPALKVRKKVFLFLGASAETLEFSCKLPESGDVLALPFTEPTGYGLGKSGWVSFSCKPGEVPPRSMLKGWIEESYRAIAPKTLIKQLDQPPG